MDTTIKLNDNRNVTPTNKDPEKQNQLNNNVDTPDTPQKTHQEIKNQDINFTIQAKEPSVTKIKKKKNRCNQCKKKIGFLKFNCKCSNKNYCSSCVQPELHNCTYNFKDDKNRLKKSLVKICSQKIIPI